MLFAFGVWKSLPVVDARSGWEGLQQCVIRRLEVRLIQSDRDGRRGHWGLGLGLRLCDGLGLWGWLRLRVLVPVQT